MFFFMNNKFTYIVILKPFEKILKDSNGYPQVGFFNIHILLIIHQVRNLYIYKLSIRFWMCVCVCFYFYHLYVCVCVCFFFVNIEICV
jgi:hypothetical protein